jgi:hypothetical protein
MANVTELLAKNKEKLNKIRETESKRKKIKRAAKRDWLPSDPQVKEEPVQEAPVEVHRSR